VGSHKLVVGYLAYYVNWIDDPENLTLIIAIVAGGGGGIILLTVVGVLILVCVRRLKRRRRERQRISFANDYLPGIFVNGHHGHHLFMIVIQKN